MSLVGQIAELQNYATYKELSWEGCFEDYLELVRKTPQVTRNAFQRLYDMILSHGDEEYIDNKKKLVRYNFFRDEHDGGKDAIFGLDIPLMRLVNVLQARRAGLRHREARHPAARPGRLVEVDDRAPAQEGHRGVLAHAPKARSTPSTGRCPARSASSPAAAETFPSPMHDEPLRLIPREWRDKAIDELELGNDDFTRARSTATSTRRAASSSRS